MGWGRGVPLRSPLPIPIPATLNLPRPRPWSPPVGAVFSTSLFLASPNVIAGIPKNVEKNWKVLHAVRVKEKQRLRHCESQGGGPPSSVARGSGPYWRLEWASCDWKRDLARQVVMLLLALAHHECWGRCGLVVAEKKKKKKRGERCYCWRRHVAKVEGDVIVEKKKKKKASARCEG